MKTKKTNRYGNGLKKFGLCAFTAALISVNVCQPYIYPVYADDVQEESSAGQENTDIEESGAQAGIETMYISTVDDFLEFAANCYIDSWSVNKKIVLRNNLDFTGRELVMVPVFAGEFDGNGHTISGIDFTGESYVTAIFRYVEENGVIDSLNVKGNIAALDEQECVGGIVGSNYGTIKNCSFEGNVSGKKTIGGIAAFNKSTGVIKKCEVRGRITGSYYTGGITGINHGIINNCANAAGINDDSAWVESEDENSSNIIGNITDNESSSIRSGIDTGGISGFSDGIIASCNNNGQVGYEHVGYNIGGIAGRQSGIILSCVNEGKVFGRKDIGGIVGQMEPYIEVVAAETIRNSVDELHDILDRTFDDLTAGKNVFHDDFADLIQHADKAVDTGHIMADEVSSFANSNMDQMNLIVERMEYVSDSLPAVLESFSQSMNSMNSMAEWIKKLNSDVDIKNRLEANSGDKAAYDAAVKQIEDAVNRFNDAVKNSSWQEIENILKDENGNYKSFDELTQDDLKAIVEAVVDIMKKANDMSQAAADVLDGINKINDILKPYFTNAGETMRNDIENAANEIQNAVNYANNAINGIKSIFTYLNAQSDIRFTRLSADFDTHRNELYAEIKNISSGLSKFNDDMSSQSDVVNKDFQDINDKINEILDLMLDKIEAYMKLDVEPLYNDVSDEEIDEQTTGRVDGCNNVGDVSADINVGGIAGAMAVDSDDLEDNAAGRTDISLGSRYLAKCVINNCQNNGYITSKKDGAGGIAGYMKLGIIRNSRSFGGVKSSDGAYAGGICGQSLSMISDSYALCSVEANKYVGGIAGYGNVIRGCYSMVHLHTESGRAGAIAGQTTAYEDEEVENDDKVTGNFYVDNGVHGIDGISYTGVAQPISYEDLLDVKGLPAGFRQLKVTFRVDDIYVGIQTFEYGQSLSEIKFPTVPKKEGCYVVWPDLSGETMTGNIVVAGEYRNNVTSVSSAQTDESGKAYAIVSDNFTEETKLNAQISRMELPKEAHMRDNVVYELTLENISEDTSDTLDVCVLNPYDKVKLYKYDGNGWVEVEHRVKGSYVQTSMQGTSGQFCLVNESTNPMIYVIIGGCTAGVLAVFIIIKVIKSGIKRRKKKAKLSDEEK